MVFTHLNYDFQASLEISDPFMCSLCKFNKKGAQCAPGEIGLRRIN